MAKVLISESKLKALADKVRKIEGTEGTYTLSEMVSALDHVMTIELMLKQGRQCNYLFYYWKSLKSAPLFDTRLITDMSGMFEQCVSLESVPAYDAGSVTNMSSMFSACIRLKSVPLFDTSSVKYMSSMFYRCTRLQSVPLFDTSSVINMISMFSGCRELPSVPLFDTSSVTQMGNMFCDCEKLKEIPCFDTSNNQSISSLFCNCRELTTIPLLDTSKATSGYATFYGCYKLQSVPALDFRSINQTTSMFSSDSSLTECWIRNVKVSISLSSSNGLTFESLINLVHELRLGLQSRTLTLGPTNLQKLANTYVKEIPVTDEMRAEDDLIDEKRPFAICNSTDEGAMLITDYVKRKNWNLK